VTKASPVLSHAPTCTGTRAGVHSLALALDSGPDGLLGEGVRDLFPAGTSLGAVILFLGVPNNPAD
jgi:hypothetical protein